jgi:acetolactate synthase-1/2/3 large subunit
MSTVADTAPATTVDAAPSDMQLAETVRLLQQAKRPLVIVGNLGWTPEAVAQFRSFVERNDLPVVAGFRSQDILDNRSEQYIGDISLGCSRLLLERVKSSDYLLVIGDRLGDVTTNHYSLFDIPAPRQVLIHVFPGPEEIGRVFIPKLGIPANSSRFAEALAKIDVLDSSAWTNWRAESRKAYVDYQTLRPETASFDMARVIDHLNEVLPEDAVVTNGAGNYTVWLHRYYRYKQLGAQIAPKSGTMGYGFPAAVAAQLRYPKRKVICLAGDGCFMMASQEFATAVQQQLPIVTIIVNNTMYGSIRMHQEKSFPNRPSGTDLLNPDFAALARSYGAHGETIDRHQDFPAALARALESGKPAVIELRVDRNQITPDRNLLQS